MSVFKNCPNCLLSRGSDKGCLFLELNRMWECLQASLVLVAAHDTPALVGARFLNIVPPVSMPSASPSLPPLFASSSLTRLVTCPDAVFLFESNEMTFPFCSVWRRITPLIHSCGPLASPLESPVPSPLHAKPSTNPPDKNPRHEQQLSACHVSNKQAGEGSSGLEAADNNSILFLERCRVHDARGAGVTCRPGGSVAIVGCELSGSGGAGLLVKGGGRAVLNDSYVYWNGGAGVHVEPMAVMSLEHNDCSLNKGGPMHSGGVIRVGGGGRMPSEGLVGGSLGVRGGTGRD